MTAYEGDTRRFTRDEEQPQHAGTGENICALIEDLLPLYVEGEVNPGSRDMIVQHLGRCAHCAGFLAGAQSVRGQLHAQQQQRTSAIHADQPAQQAVSGAQIVLQSIAFLAAAGLGVMGTVILGDWLNFREPGMLIGGSVAGMLSLGMLLALARVRGAVNGGRTTLLMGSIGLAAFGTLLISGTPLGLLLMLLGFGGGWYALFQPSGTQGSAQATAVQLTKIFVGLAVCLSILVGGVFLLGAVQSSITLNGLFILGVLGVIFFAQGRAGSCK